jgi:DNA-binding response OmpR family regulator
MSSARPGLLDGRHVVVADADSRVLALMTNTLRDAGFCVFQAYDGLAACQLALAIPTVDLLITNTRMPGLDGLALVAEVRRRLPALPILYLAHDQASIPEVRRRLPADIPILQVPSTADKVLAAIQPLLSKGNETDSGDSRQGSDGDRT